MATNAPHLQAPHHGESDAALGYGYQWWIPEGSDGEFKAIGIFGQWIYVNPSKNVLIVKTSADPNFEENDSKPMTVEFFKAIGESL